MTESALPKLLQTPGARMTMHLKAVRLAEMTTATRDKAECRTYLRARCPFHAGDPRGPSATRATPQNVISHRAKRATSPRCVAKDPIWSVYRDRTLKALATRANLPMVPTARRVFTAPPPGSANAFAAMTVTAVTGYGVELSSRTQVRSVFAMMAHPARRARALARRVKPAQIAAPTTTTWATVTETHKTV